MIPKVFVLIVNWNGWNDTLACLSSLLKVDYENLYVIISDNGSVDKSLKKAKAWAEDNLVPFALLDGSPCSVKWENRPESNNAIKELFFIENHKNLGFTGANKVGMVFALENACDYVLFLNNDTTVTKDFLRKMVEVAEQDSSYGLITCKILLPDLENGKPKIWGAGHRFNFFGNPQPIAHGQYDGPRWAGLREAAYTTGCCMLIKRRVIEEIGFQDDNLFFCMDDVEYSLRAKKYGWKNIVTLDAIVYHKAGASCIARKGLGLYYIFRNTYFLRKKYFSRRENVLFWLIHPLRYFIVAGIVRTFWGRWKTNLGMILGIYDFARNRGGECPYKFLLRKHR